MNRTITLSSAVAALLVAGATTAYAQDRQPVTIDRSEACGTVTLTFTNPSESVHGFRWNAVAGNVSSGDGARTGLVTVGSKATVEETITFEEDEFDGTAAVTVSVAFGPDSDIQPRLDIYPVDTDCKAAEDPEPTDTPDPTVTPTREPTDEPDRDRPRRHHRHDRDESTTDPTSTTTPAPTTVPAPAVDDPAPVVVDRDPVDVDIDNNIEVVTPRGGVEAGGGPA